jgi:hypothetical protein
MKRRWQVNFTVQCKIPKHTQKSNKETTISELARDHVTFTVHLKGHAALMPKQFADVSSWLLMRQFADVLGNWKLNWQILSKVLHTLVLIATGQRGDDYGWHVGFSSVEGDFSRNCLGEAGISQMMSTACDTITRSFPKCKNTWVAWSGAHQRACTHHPAHCPSASWLTTWGCVEGNTAYLTKH